MSRASSSWATLSIYESVEFVKRFSRERTGREPTDAEAREVAAYFAQGREYFRSAAGAGELVRPLLVYYGAVALARGTALFLTDPGEGPGLAPAHGLSAGKWEDLLARSGAVPDLPVKVQKKGTFAELWRATGNADWCVVRYNMPPGPLTFLSPGSALPHGTGVTIKEALGQIPDVAELYERTFGEHPRRLRCEVEVTGIPEPDLVDAFYRNEVPPDREVRRHAQLGIVPTRAGLVSKDRVAAVLGGRVAFRETRTDVLHFARDPMRMVGEWHLFDLYYDAGSRERRRQEMPVATDASGEEYLKLPTDSGVVLSTLLALHLVAFAAGTLVRYHPGYWAMLAGRATMGDSVAPVLSAAVSAVEERYPALVLEALEGPS